jgi:hypothetical protein
VSAVLSVVKFDEDDGARPKMTKVSVARLGRGEGGGIAAQDFSLRNTRMNAKSDG